MTPKTLRAPRAARFALAAGLLLSLTGAVAAAQPTGGGQGEAALRAACAGDVKTLCPGIQPGGGRLKACLKQNSDKVSVGCAKALVEVKRSKAAGQGPGAQPGTP